MDSQHPNAPNPGCIARKPWPKPKICPYGARLIFLKPFALPELTGCGPAPYFIEMRSVIKT